MHRTVGWVGAGDAVAAYNVLRSFSWQLRLSPFGLEDWCAAVAAPHSTPLLDEVHVCVLRLLAQDESRVRRSSLIPTFRC